MPHYFINSKTLTNNHVIISDKETYNHIAKSLRSRVGEDILLIDENQIQHEGKIQKITSNSIEIQVMKSYKSERKLEFKLYLAQSPLRSDAQSFIVEKATELGIEGIYPILTDNCAVKKSVIEQKISRWQKIMAEASKQCERAYIPTFFELTSIEKLVSSKEFDRVLAFTERNANYKLKNYLNENPILKNEKILVIIGPEGGFSDKEFDFFEENKITSLSLGNLILTAETAVITALGNIVL
ncbi:MAG: RsmE family RNA methyltransferase [Candidatus Gastranaerophilales bacterium]|nr:RsmE family RNA methyltransferase [Candidatus Gastranaerophilales bacterium]